MKEKEKKELLELLRWYKAHVEHEQFMKMMKNEARKAAFESMYNIHPKPWKPKRGTLPKGF